MKELFILLFLCIFNNCLSQSKQDLRNIDVIDAIVNVNMDINDKNSYLIYSVGNKIIVIDSCRNEVTYLSKEHSQQIPEKNKLSNEDVIKLFRTKNIKKGKIYSNNDYDNSCVGSYVYLSIINNQKKSFQLNLPFILMCDKNKIKYPFDYKSLNFLNSLVNK